MTAKDLTSIAGKEQGQATSAGLLPLTFTVATGKGTLYYTAELRTSYAAQNVEPRDEGIGVAYDVLDENGAPVQGTTLALGKVYTMRVVFYSSKDRTYVALRAPLPSGAEPIDGSLLTSQIVKQPADQSSDQGGDQSEDQGSDTGYQGDYGDYGYITRIYDSEVRFFFDELARGKHEVSFLFRTTTPGTFPTPPVRAELMYQPEVFGRTGGTVFQIVDQK